MGRAIYPVVTSFTIALAMANAPAAMAQCGFIDFEDRVINSVVTDDYYGVTFSTVGGSCGPNDEVYMRVANDFSANEFDTNVLLIDAGCPDFSVEYLRIVFDVPQSEVAFLLGPWTGNYQVRAYTTIAGSTGLIEAQSIFIPGTGFVDVKHSVRVTSASADIRRIEVEAPGAQFEAIDELRFVSDDTPPEVEIVSPPPGLCVCGGEVPIAGISCDDLAVWDHDELEYLRIHPTVDDEWTLADTFYQPGCSAVTLYRWNVDSPSIPEGRYIVRVTAYNDCGLTGSDQVDVIVDRDFDQVEIRKPSNGDVLGGIVCVDGTAWDNYCFQSYAVDYRPIGGGPWSPVDPNIAAYGERVENDPLAYWDSRNVPDGVYELRLIGNSLCASSVPVVRAVTIDNTPPLATITAPGACETASGLVTIAGTAFDANIEQWSLEYWDPGATQWQPIATGNTAIINDVLGTWDTAGLQPCQYSVRLRVTDVANTNHCGSAAQHRTDYYMAVEVGEDVPCCPGDTNRDGFVNFRDIDPFVDLINTTCP